MTKFFRHYIFIPFFILIGFQSVFAVELNDGERYASNSVLSKGKWIKIKVGETGIYKITYDDLTNFGISDPKNVQIYGYGGSILDEKFSNPYIDDLPQVSVWMSKNRASFAKGDYLLFYGKGSIKWSYNSQKKEFEQTQNPYSSDSYYFITEAAEGPLLMETQQSTLLGGTLVTTFDDYFLHEKELINIGTSGREFYGEKFRLNTPQTFPLNLEGITADEAIFRYNFISRAELSSGILEVSLNGLKVKTRRNELSNSEYTHATLISDTLKRTNLQAQNNVGLNYNGLSADKNMYLDYIRVNYKRKLQLYGAATLFRTTSQSDNLQFQIAQASASMLVFDVTKNDESKKIDTQLAGGVLSFNAPNKDIMEYALVDLSKINNIPTPTWVGKVANQDLHASQSVDMVIIVQPYLQKYAEQLAQLHTNDSGLKSLIVNPEDIYNEFSSGKPDATAYRRFVKMLYDRASIETDKPQYLLLFGGGTYDNRFIERWTDTDKKSMLLTYQSKESLIETISYVSDDYFGFLDDNEGDNDSEALLDIGIGRLAVRSQQEAETVVEKIKDYMSPSNRGIWANNVTFVADDAIASGRDPVNEKQHMIQAEELSTFVSTNSPNFMVNKVYEDAYERVIEATGARYPDARQALFERINKGTLFLNYLGHGSTTSLAHENLVTYTDIEALTNDKLPLWITATCDFSRFDANETSAGEMALLNPNGGAIALYSTVRAVFAEYNKIMNTNLIKHIFDKKNGKPMRLGDIIRYAKLEKDMKGDINKLKFMLLGDPALKLAYPDDTYRVRISEINGKEIGDEPVNLEAVSNVLIKGAIVDISGEVVTDFNGVLESIVFDAIQKLATRGNAISGINEKVKMEYTDYINKLLSGKTEIKNGVFDLSFVVPKDILYIGGKGKMSFLALENESGRSAQGSFLNYTVGGTNIDAIPELNPPVISKMYLNKEQFQSGGYVNSTPVFFAEISDDTGINLSSGIGHNLAIIIDGKYPYDLSDYFMNENNSIKSGKIQFQLPAQTKGMHTLEFRVWDVWNNATTRLIEFNIDEGQNSANYTFYIWGNPAKESTMFVVDNDSPEKGIDLRISVYSMSGRLFWAHEERGGFNTLNRYSYIWNLYGAGIGRLIPGVYICVLDITIGGKVVSRKTQKLIVGS